MPAIPKRLPDPSWPALRARLEAAGHDTDRLLKLPLFVVAVRGLFSLTIGAPGNDINVYDDGLYVVQPAANGDPVVKTWNANTDPTRYGRNAHAGGKFMARLKPGFWWMQERLHGGRYRAFGQCESPVTVERIDEAGNVRQTETGCFGIDLHPGGINSTSSEGCQTVPRETWESLYNLIYKVMKRAPFPYILMDA